MVVGLLRVEDMTSKLSIEAILSESERESSRYTWEGTFADYLRMVIQNPSQSRLSHSLVYDAIKAQGVEVSPDGETVYGLFEGNIFGLERHLDPSGPGEGDPEVFGERFTHAMDLLGVRRVRDLAALPEGAVVGTSSLRRGALLR